MTSDYPEPQGELRKYRLGSVSTSARSPILTKDANKVTVDLHKMTY